MKNPFPMSVFSKFLFTAGFAAFTATAFASPPEVSPHDSFTVEPLVPLPEAGLPELAWRDDAGLTVQMNGRYLHLAEGAAQWEAVEGDPVALSGSALQTADGGRLYGIEGSEVFTLEYRAGRILRENRPALPFVVEAGQAVVSKGALYVAGLDASGRNVFLQDGIELAPWSDAPAQKVLAAQSQGRVFVFADEAGTGQLSIYEYNSNLSQWTAHGRSDFPVSAEAAFACGDGHLLLPGSGVEQLYGYYVTQKKWVAYELPALPLEDFEVISEYKRFTVFSPEGVRQVEAIFPGTKYGIYDHLIVAAFFVFMLWIGKYLSKREKTGNDFFRGGQRLPWWAVGLSMFATGASAISLMAMPAKAYMENWIYAAPMVLMFVELPFVILFIIPITRRLKFSSAYEYLEVRFNRSVRMLGSIIYVAMQILGRMATIMLLPSVALSAICGIPMDVSILIMGIVTTIYCTMGGFEAVIWTDVIQAFVMLLAMVISVIWIFLSIDSSVADAWQLIMAEDKLKMVDFSWDMTQPIIYIIVISWLFNFFGRLGDQNFIQRVQATPTERQARKAVVTQLAVAIPLNVCLFGLGTCLFLYYNQHPSEISPAMKADGIFPLFAAQKLPTGLAGLVVAALMAATMSTLSSALNSVSNIGVEDYVKRFKPDLSPRGALLWGKGLTIFLGGLGTFLALLLAKSHIVSIWDLAILVGGILFAPMTAFYLLGVMTRRANATGVWIGGIAAIAVSVYCNQNLSLHPFFFPVISMGVCVGVGYTVSLLFPGPPRDLKGLTVFSLPEKNEDF